MTNASILSILAHATPTPTSRSKGQKSKSRGGGILWRPPSRTACLDKSSVKTYMSVFRMFVNSQSSHVLGIKCSTLHVDGKPTMVTMDYKMDVASLSQECGRAIMQERLVY